MNNKPWEMIKKYAEQLGEMDGYTLGSGKIMVNINGRIYETRNGSDFCHLKKSDVEIFSGIDLGSDYPIEHRLLKKDGEMKAIVLSKTPYCRKTAALYRDLTAAVDDMAQIVGQKVYTVIYDERAVGRALSKAAGCFVHDRYTITMGRNLYEAVVALTVLEKSAEINMKAEVLGGVKTIPVTEAKRMRMIYMKKYSKAEQEVKAEEGRH